MGDTDGDRHLPEARESSKTTTRTSTLPDLTKQPDWSQRITDGIPAFLHLLDISGRILYASASCKKITGHEPASLQGRFITELIHRDDKALFVKEFNRAILSRALFRLIYRFQHADGEWLVLESQGHFTLDFPQEAASAAAATTPVSPERQLFLLTSLPYMSPNATKMDSFLELKTDNARLAARIARLKQEAQEAAESLA
jgi:PAS domain S-box-containing protein